MKRKAILLLLPMLCISLQLAVSAAGMNGNYTYNTKGEAQSEPDAYVPESIITGKGAGTTDFSNPQDFYLASNGWLYVADSGNNRIVVLDNQYRFVKSIDHFRTPKKENDTWNNPQGVFVTQDGCLYVADTGNQRIVVMNGKDQVAQVISPPKSAMIPQNFKYAPTKVAVDFAKRVFVVSQNSNEGIVEFDAQGNFSSFFGAIRVVPDLTDVLWRMVATKEQKARMSLTVPTEYANLDMDRDGFVYGCVSAINTDNGVDPDMFLHKLNPMGEDVLKRNGTFAPMGDVDYTVNMQDEPSAFCDVKIGDSGIYSALDSRRGRVFTYSMNGDLLYVFGSLGSYFGQFGMPVALERTSAGKYLILDSKYQWIDVYAPTHYGGLIEQAAVSQYNRDYRKADALWKEALKYTAQSELVYNGMAWACYKQADYVQAMKYYRLAENRGGYSDAFGEYLGELMTGSFNLIVIGLVCLAAAVVILRVAVKRHRKRGMEK